jgi:16S rRNA (guanine966-N2)-methyltransferase
MRIVGGKYRSRRLGSLPGRDLRPTSDRLRETLFNVLTAGNPSALEGTVWLDLFAGTGAVGIEALSRGAKFVSFVESSPKAVELIRKNLTSLGVAPAAFRILQDESARFLRKRSDQADFVFLDPPYRMQAAYVGTLQALAENSLRSALIIAEHEKRFDPGEGFGVLKRQRKLVQGDAALSFYKMTKES